jgi:hypothetical protein
MAEGVSKILTEGLKHRFYSARRVGPPRDRESGARPASLRATARSGLNLRVACQLELTITLASVSEGWRARQDSGRLHDSSDRRPVRRQIGWTSAMWVSQVRVESLPSLDHQCQWRHAGECAWSSREGQRKHESRESRLAQRDVNLGVLLDLGTDRRGQKGLVFGRPTPIRSPRYENSTPP